MTIERYEHHGKMVAVQPFLKGSHRDHCLCYQGCIFFQPGSEEHCEIATANFENCKKFGTVQPVYECPKFATDDPIVMIHRNSYELAMQLRAAAQEFCDRVEAGKVRSTYTYNKFKKLLEDNDGT